MRGFIIKHVTARSKDLQCLNYTLASAVLKKSNTIFFRLIPSTLRGGWF